MSGKGFQAWVLAAGQGTRMKSALPKVLHGIAGRPMVGWAMGAAIEAGADRLCVVVRHGAQEVAPVVEALGQSWGVSAQLVQQGPENGTGAAALAVVCGTEPVASEDPVVVILYGDCPLVPSGVIRALVDRLEQDSAVLALVTSRLENPTGYGRIVRDGKGTIQAIREQKDCSVEEQAIAEVNPGIYAARASFLRGALPSLTTENAQRELLLTDIVDRAVGATSSGGPVVTSIDWPMDELLGVNDRWQLAQAESCMQERLREAHARNGVTLRNPGSISLEASVTIGEDSVVESGVVLRGSTEIGRGVHVDVGCVLENVTVEEGAQLLPYTVARDCHIGTKASVGPFAHLRPKTQLGPHTKVGNFVEMKNTSLGAYSKAGHLSYLGDGVVGEGVNIGAGTIFCNYDGWNKHVTHLEDGSFIGSDSQLVAPVRVGQGAYVATGTTVTQDVPADGLAISRPRQQNKEGYAARLRSRLKSMKPEAP